jgi:hypothetical protein
MLKAVAEIPMVTARERTTNAVAPGRRPQERKASLKSEKKLGTIGSQQPVCQILAQAARPFQGRNW